MSTLDLDSLRTWRRIWEIPELWSALCRQEKRLPTDEVARMVVRRLANPTEPKEIFRELLQMGEFDAASELLQLPAFRKSIKDLKGDLDALSDELAHEQASRLRTFDQRALVLRMRAQRIEYAAGLDRRLDEARQRCVKRVADAEQALHRLDEELVGRESARSEPVPGPDGGAPVPYNTTWPFEDPPALCCRWFLAAASLLDEALPAGFIDRWAASDEPALGLITTMHSVLAPAQALDAAAVSVFALALERFLGCEADDEPPVVLEKDGTFRTVLRGLPSHGLPAFSRTFYPDGLPLLLQSGTARISEFPESLSILFNAEPLVCPERVLQLQPHHLFPLMKSSSHRGLHVIRALAAQLPYTRMMPMSLLPTPDLRIGRDAELRALQQAQGPVFVVAAEGMGKSTLLRAYELSMDAESLSQIEIVDELDKEPEPRRRVEELLARDSRAIITCTPGLWQELLSLFSSPPQLLLLQPLPLEEIRAYLLSLFDMLNISCEPPQLLEQLVFCSGGHPGILFSLLRQLFEHQASRSVRKRVSISEAALDAAWSATRFRQISAEMLLEPLSRRPPQLQMLYRLIELSDGTSGGAEQIEIDVYLSLFEPELPRDQALSALEVLVHRGLVRRDNGPPACISLAPSSLSLLCTQIVPNFEQVLRQVLERHE